MWKATMDEICGICLDTSGGSLTAEGVASRSEHVPWGMSQSILERTYAFVSANPEMGGEHSFGQQIYNMDRT